MAKTNRLIWLDNLKFVLIFLVVLGHCIQHSIDQWQTDIVFRYIYSFHMPLFIFVSGFACYKNELQWKMISKRFMQLMIPFFTYTLIAALIGKDWHIFLNDILHPEKGLWFLWALFFITVIHVTVSRLAVKIKIKDEIANVAVMLVLLGMMRHYALFCFPTIAKFFMYYILGFYSRKYWTSLKLLQNKVVCVTALCVFLTLAFFSMQGAAPSFMPEGISPVYGQIYNMCVSFIAIFAFIGLFAAFVGKSLKISTIIGGGTRLVYTESTECYLAYSL